MPKKYAAFDIETAKVLPASADDLKSHRPLGISCAALWCTDQDEPELFYSQTPDGSPAPRMSRLPVEKATELPKPDTFWMDNPWKRSKFTGWLD